MKKGNNRRWGTAALTVVALAVAARMWAQGGIERVQLPGGMDYPRIYKMAFADGGIVKRMTDDGRWAIYEQGLFGGGELATKPRIIDVETMEAVELVDDDMMENISMCRAYDISRDGSVVVGQLQNQPAVWRRGEGWEILDTKAGWIQGEITRVTPDGRFGIGNLNYFQRKPNDLGLTGEFDYMPAAWNLETGEIIGCSQLPEYDILHLRLNQSRFTDVTPDGRYAIGQMSWSYVQWDEEGHTPVTAYVYDLVADTCVMLGFTPDVIDDWQPLYPGYSNIGSAAFTPDGRYAYGWAGGRRFIFENATYEFRMGGNTDNTLNAYSRGVSFSTEQAVQMSPLYNWSVRYGRHSVPFTEICRMGYGFDYNELTGYDYTGTVVGNKPDGSVVAAWVDPNVGESYIVDFGEPIGNVCASIDLLGSYTIAPASGIAVAQAKTVSITFERSIEVLAGAHSIRLVDGSGKTIRESLTFEPSAVNDRMATVSFRTVTLTEGEHYSIVIPAGAICLKGDRAITNREIAVEYVGRKLAPVSAQQVWPDPKDALSKIEYETSPVMLTFDTYVVPTDTARAYIINNESGTQVCQLTVAYKDNMVVLYPASAQYLFDGQEYTVVLGKGAVCDVMGACANDEIRVSYRGNYVRDISSQGRYIFRDAFDNIANSLVMWLRYDGDHNEPMAAMKEWEFDADNQPWNFSTRDEEGLLDYCMASHSMYSPSGKSDDWAVIPQLHIPDGKCRLEFDAQSYREHKCDTLTVLLYCFDEYVSELSSDFVKQMAEGADTLVHARVYPGEREDMLVNDWQHFSIDLARYEGKNVYIAFVNSNYNQSVVFVDNVVVEHTLDYTLASNTPAAVVQKESVDVSGVLHLHGDEFVFDRVKLTLRDSEGRMLEEFAADIAGDTIRYAFAKPLPLQVGKETKYSIDVELSGAEADNPQATVVERTSVNASVADLLFETTKRVVLEEQSGRDCGNCPMGILAIEEMKRQAGDRFLPVSIFTFESDPLGTGMYSYASWLGYSAAPIARINRHQEQLAPMWQNVIEGDPDYAKYSFHDKLNGKTWQDAVQQDFEQGTYCNVTANAYLDDASEVLTVPFSVSSAIDQEHLNLSVFAIVVEDSLTALYQHNYFSAYEEPIFGVWGKNGIYGTEYPLNITQNNVARACLGTSFAGTVGLLPTSFAAGETASVELQFAKPQTVDDWRNARVVVMLIDANTGVVINACDAKVELCPEVFIIAENLIRRHSDADCRPTSAES